MDAGGRQIDPRQITVHYDWRTQLGHNEWHIDRIEVSGRWLPKAPGEEPPPGSGAVVMWMAIAPEWAQAFAEANMPTSALVDPVVEAEVPEGGIKSGQWRLDAMMRAMEESP